MSENTNSNLEKQLWAVANTLRGKMNADDYRDYILGLIFYKYLSERMSRHANHLLKTESLPPYSQLSEQEHREYLQAIKTDSLDVLGFYLAPHQLFSHLITCINNNQLSRELRVEQDQDQEQAGKVFYLIEDLQAALRAVENSTSGTSSEEDFDKLFEDLDLDSTKLGKTIKARNKVLVNVLIDLDKVDFELGNSESDVLGDAYEYLIKEFASNAGKKAGEFYTPQQVSTVLAKLVTQGKTNLQEVYDPTCGSGSLLLRVAKEVEDKKLLKFYGQEMNRTTYNLARMNLIMHGIHHRDFDIKQEDTLLYPQHQNLKAEAIVANPPFSSNWAPPKSMANNERFAEYGRLAPNTKADFAFVQHMIHHLKDEGTMAVVLPHGVLFRGSAEAVIRKHLIQTNNYLDAVIGLPANIFYGTGIPTCILVFKKQRTDPQHVLFIDASQGFEKVKKQNELRPEDIHNIITTYQERTSKDKYSYLAPLSEIADNDYNLNIPRYVDTFEEEEPIQLPLVSQKLKAIQQEIQETDAAIRDYCQQLGIDPPF